MQINPSVMGRFVVRYDCTYYCGTSERISLHAACVRIYIVRELYVISERGNKRNSCVTQKPVNRVLSVMVESPPLVNVMCAINTSLTNYTTAVRVASGARAYTCCMCVCSFSLPC